MEFGKDEIFVCPKVIGCTIVSNVLKLFFFEEYGLLRYLDGEGYDCLD